MEVQPTEWPLERIISNLEEGLRQHPDDGDLHYLLGRALGFAFALERDSLWSMMGSGVTSDLPEQRERFLERPTDAVPPARALERLASGISHLRRACDIVDDPACADGNQFMHDWWNARKHLTYAWLLETGAHLADRVDTPAVLGVKRPLLMSDESEFLEQRVADLGSEDASVAAAAQRALATPPNLERVLTLLYRESASPLPRRQRAVSELLERYWIERAIAEYWVAYQQNVERDLSIDGWEIDRLVSYEALLGYDRLVRRRGVQGQEEEQRLTDLVAVRKRLEAHPSGAYVTPLLVSLRDCKTLDDLVTYNLPVPFDLDGDGIDELWPWLAPDAGWLVWDPEHRGEITSGRQLFGTASAWLFFSDGYRVLDALDDDRDGALRGAELAGIAVWFDRDTDGISDRGEVVPVEALGIAALRTEATLMVGASPANLCGIEMEDGQVLPSYDWVLSPAAP